MKFIGVCRHSIRLLLKRNLLIAIFNFQINSEGNRNSSNIFHSSSELLASDWLAKFQGVPIKNDLSCRNLISTTLMKMTSPTIHVGTLILALTQPSFTEFESISRSDKSASGSSRMAFWKWLRITIASWVSNGSS